MKDIKKYIKESEDLGGRSFVIIKPEFQYLANYILCQFFNAGYIIEQSKTKLLSLKEARALYRIHNKEDWYDDLCKYMSSDLVTAFIFKNDKLTPDEAIKDTEKIKDQIRKDYAESDMKNVLHSSDSIENMKKEQGIFFNTL